jgi:TolB-like protein/DNA-binding winged helix-turn-helix (wHTH) protein/tetratricopeptide (TPR) repeat protein
MKEPDDRLPRPESPERTTKTNEIARKRGHVGHTAQNELRVFARGHELDRGTQEFADVPSRLALADFVLDLGREALLDAHGQGVELRPQAYQVLRYLALNAGRLVTKDELMASVWPGSVVTDDSLVQAIGDVRRALGEPGHGLVKTVPRRGYMLVPAAVTSTVPERKGDSDPPASDHARGWRVVGGVVVLLLIAGMLWQGLARNDTAPPSANTHAPPSIAVLAFKGPPGDPDGDALGHDVAADLVSELARSPGLRVVASQSSFQFAGGQTPLAEIGQRLRSRYIAAGTVRRDGEQLRIVVELLDSQGGQVVWASSNLVDRTTLAATQSALVSRIAGTLQTKVSRAEQRQALAQPPKSLDIYVLVARGRAMQQRYTAQGMRESRRFFEQALAIDPGYAPAWAYLGITNTVDIGLRLTGEWDNRRLGEVLSQIRHAIALQPDLPVAYLALAQAQALDRNFDAMLAAAHRTCQLSPNDADCFFILGHAQYRMGEVEAAARNFEQALDRNPMPPAYLPAFYATALWGSRRLDEAVRVADECLAKAPEFWRCRQDRIAALVELGRISEAREEAIRLLAQTPQMTAEGFGFTFADTATALRQRRIAAARAAGIPADTRAPPAAGLRAPK